MPTTNFVQFVRFFLRVLLATAFVLSILYVGRDEIQHMSSVGFFLTVASTFSTWCYIIFFRFKEQK